MVIVIAGQVMASNNADLSVPDRVPDFGWFWLVFCRFSVGFSFAGA
jgi:hypothetical protein